MLESTYLSSPWFQICNLHHYSKGIMTQRKQMKEQKDEAEKHLRMMEELKVVRAVQA